MPLPHDQREPTIGLDAPDERTGQSGAPARDRGADAPHLTPRGRPEGFEAPQSSASPRELRLNAASRRVWPTWNGEASTDFTLAAEARVAVVGDWESNADNAEAVLGSLKQQAPDLRTVLHLGDLRYTDPALNTRFVSTVDALLERYGFARLLLTPGNHDWWDQLQQEFRRHPDRPYRIGQRVWVLPRGFRFQLRQLMLMSFGGAASVETGRASRRWSAHEVPTDADVDMAIRSGPVDVLLTHEPPDAGIPEVQAIIGANDKWRSERVHESAQSRARITRLVEALHPAVTFHGHMHVSGQAQRRDGRATFGISVAGSARSAGILDLTSVTFTWLGENEPAFARLPDLDA